MSFIAGRYTAVWNSLSLGQTERGFDVGFQRFTEPITGDAGADTEQDGINRGADFDVIAQLLEYNAAAVATLTWPISGTAFDMGVIGVLDSSKWQSMIFTALAGTPAASTPATLTCARSILKPRFPVRLLLAPSLRKVPIAMKVYPNGSVFATQT